MQLERFLYFVLNKKASKYCEFENGVRLSYDSNNCLQYRVEEHVLPCVSINFLSIASVYNCDIFHWKT